MANKKRGFDQAYEELQEIVASLQDDETGIDSLSSKMKRAKELVEFCRDKLREVEEDIEAIEFDDEEQ
ncbi:MAG: exodeoxyribonuclease VII small subunit [Saprospiraceae bacterium]|jgi:exodeoxyribonuclease VII small subunit|nr:exodeoxyribonuclease VII small subunit [Chitinophagia bacterium]